MTAREVVGYFKSKRLADKDGAGTLGWACQEKVCVSRPVYFSELINFRVEATAAGTSRWLAMEICAPDASSYI
jgi:hypothetical protein